MQQGFGVILLADEYIRARREAAFDLARTAPHVRAARATRRGAAAPVRRLSIRVPRFAVTLTVTRTGRPARAE